MGTISDILEAVDRLSANDLQTLMEKLEDKRDLELLAATRDEECVPFSEYLNASN